MGEKIGKYLVGGLTAILLTCIIQLLISFKVIPLGGFSDWISATKNPQLTLWASSLFSASIFLTAPHIGIQFEWVKKFFDFNHPSFDYLFGLPWQATTFLILVSGAILFLLRPACEAPMANISVDAAKEVVVQDFDGNSIKVKTGSIITFSAEEIGSSIIFCNWSFSGQVIKSISSLSSCTTQVNVANESGLGILTLTLSRGYCPTISTRTVEINVIP